jgi:hypothetical protein
MALPLIPILLVAGVGGGLYALLKGKKKDTGQIDGGYKLPIDEPAVEPDQPSGRVRPFMIQNASGLENPEMPGPWYAYVGSGLADDSTTHHSGPHVTWQGAYDAAVAYIYAEGDVPEYVGEPT